MPSRLNPEEEASPDIARRESCKQEVVEEGFNKIYD